MTTTNFRSILQVHRFLKCDCRDAFNITDDEFVAFVEMEVIQMFVSDSFSHDFDRMYRLVFVLMDSPNFISEKTNPIRHKRSRASGSP